MSHFTKLRTKMTDKECLIKTLSNLNYNVLENSTIKGYGGRTRKGDIVIKTRGTYDVGFIKSSLDGSFEIIADWYGAARTIGMSRGDFLKEVQKEYAVTKVLQEIRKKGYRLKSRQYLENTGEIKLLVVKRGFSR
ncbi:MAG: DUF1257 domain-containing protein [Candidatus Thorarchaeota archaeon]